MHPTTVKLPDGLKKRIATVAKARGKSMHSFLVEAIERATDEAELRQEFVARALASRAEVARTRKLYGADEVHAYILARASGKKARRPKARSWPR
jgi:predicted transcriptional regulator